MSITILTGIVVYRQLDHLSRQKVMREIQKVRKINPRLHGKLFSLPPLIVADKYKFKWSLSDTELKRHYESSTGVSSALRYLGIDLRTYGASVAAIGAAILEASKSGLKAGAKETIKSSSNYNLASELAEEVDAKPSTVVRVGHFAALVTILASGVRTMALVNEEEALKEMYLRGMVEP